MKFDNFISSASKIIQKRSPEILTGIGIAGMIAAMVITARATIKAQLLLNEKEIELKVDKLEPRDIVKTTWKCYIPAVATGCVSIACIIGGLSVNSRRNAALAAAYTTVSTNFLDYKNKVTDVIGKEKEKDIRDKVTKDRVDKQIESSAPIIFTGEGDTLCFDAYTGRLFTSSRESLRRGENDLNRMILKDGSATLNDFYYLIGLDELKHGDMFGWDTRHEFALEFGSQLTKDGRPCLVMDFVTLPSQNFYE